MKLRLEIFVSSLDKFVIKLAKNFLAEAVSHEIITSRNFCDSRGGGGSRDFFSIHAVQSFSNKIIV